LTTGFIPSVTANL